MVVCLALQGAELHVSEERTTVTEEGEAVKNYVLSTATWLFFHFAVLKVPVQGPEILQSVLHNAFGPDWKRIAELHSLGGQLTKDTPTVLLFLLRMC